jgi:hypothetical protein
MTALEPVIAVRELPPVCSSQRQHLPSIRELVSPTPGPQERAILAYLAQGFDCGIYNDPGMLYDVLEPGKRIDFSSVQEVPEVSDLAPHLIMTDGVWVWPGAVLYYIAVYHIRLPDALLRHAERCGWKIDPSQFSREELNWDAFDAVGVATVEVP